MKSVAFATVATGATVAIAIARIVHVLSRQFSVAMGVHDRSDGENKWKAWVRNHCTVR